MHSAARLPHATVIGDFSKALCLSGLRVGWMVDHDPDRRASYCNARNYFTVTNNVVGERLAAFARQHREAIHSRAQRTATDNLARLDRLFAEHSDVLCWRRPCGGMTAFPWLAYGRDARDLCRRLAQHGVLIVPGDSFGEPSHFRLGFAASGERFGAGVDRLGEFIRDSTR